MAASNRGTRTADASRSAHERMNGATFGNGMRSSASSVKRNQVARKKMTPAQVLTGMTAEQLTEVQRSLREDFLRRAA